MSERTQEVVSASEREQFQNDGFLVRDALTAGETAAFREAAESLLARERFAAPRLHYVSFLMPEIDAPALHPTIHLPTVLATVEDILGGELCLDNAVILAAAEGVQYVQGWHRDVLQVPQDLIDERMFSPDWFHNNIQINLALNDDACFWLVPGSHRRLETPGEREAFAGSRHMSPIEAEMPGGVNLALRPGQAVFYNNNLIHRGYADPVQTPRRSLHLGYHTVTRPPTWHFYGLKMENITPDYLATLSPTVRQMVTRILAERSAYPDVTATYRAGA